MDQSRLPQKVLVRIVLKNVYNIKRLAEKDKYTFVFCYVLFSGFSQTVIFTVVQTFSKYMMTLVTSPLK